VVILWSLSLNLCCSAGAAVFFRRLTLNPKVFLCVCEWVLPAITTKKQEPRGDEEGKGRACTFR